MRPAEFDFSDLHYDRLFDALIHLGIYPENGLLALNSYENRVYQYREEDGKEYVVKFYRPARWQDAQIEEEHQFTLTLQQAHLPVAAPLSYQGKTLHHDNGQRFAIFPRLRGRALELDNLNQLDAFGTLLGQVHAIGAQQSYQTRPTICLTEFVTEPTEILKMCSLIPKSQQPVFFDALTKLTETLKKTWHQDWTSCRLHGDAHASNLLYDQKAMLVDFDDSRNGPAIQDIWLSLNGDRGEQQAQLSSLIECYEENYEFNPAELRLIEPLRAMRMINYMGWLAKRWSDPAFPRAFPWFSEAQYWQQQTQFLQQQQQALLQAPLTLQPQW